MHDTCCFDLILERLFTSTNQACEELNISNSYYTEMATNRTPKNQVECDLKQSKIYTRTCIL